MPATIVYSASGPVVAYDAPEAHGAHRDGVTDDTAAIQAAINGAVAAGVANGTNYAEVWFSAGRYLVAGASGGHGTPTFANSQITLPFISPSTAQKFTLVLRGTLGGSALPHWNQTIGQKGGAVLYTNITGTNDGTYGPASVVGGPTAKQGYGGGTGTSWSNMQVIVDGVSVVSSTANPTMCGFNFEGLLQAKIGTSGYMADATPAAMSTLITTISNFTNTWTFGVAMPSTNNNDLSIIDDWSAEGVWYSAQIGEHCHVRDMRSVYCGWGLMLDNRVSTPYWARVNFFSSELTGNIMGLLAGPTGNFKISIDMIDTEVGGDIWDGNSLIYGNIRVGGNSSPAPFDWTTGGLANWIGGWSGNPTNGRYMRIICPDVITGTSVNQPAIPASGTLQYNYTTHDCAVSISGGTVTVIAIDGSTTNRTSGTFIVPAGKSIAITYSAAPTWRWVLF